ncbi:hypothetical protein, partial [Lacticaseibacillus thailandensis]|uniref:hypothetical protein n=1 Tax=Lacticaseibacillus thailandensis TaxID=381741 RepID=UPI00138ED2C5
TFDTDDETGQTVTLQYTANGDYTVTTPGGQESTPTPYQTDPTDPKKATGTVPGEPGYTPTVTGGKLTETPTGDYTLTPDDPTKPATVT